MSEQLSKFPSRGVTVVACMDTRLDLFGALGLAIGEVHILRNAGGLVTPDVLRSVAISQRALRTREVWVVQHTLCGMQGLDDAAFRRELAEETGAEPDWDVPGFADVREQVRSSVAQVQECPWVPHRDAVRGFVYRVEDDTVEQVV